MRREIIITDLTRFSEGKDTVCMAGIDVNTFECIRPFKKISPGYLTKEDCKKFNILPGSKISAEFIDSPTIDLPHTEDKIWTKVNSHEHCSSTDFLRVLENTDKKSIRDGFGISLPTDTKFFLNHDAANLTGSIITIELSPNNLLLVEDRYKHGSIRVHVSDNYNFTLKFLPLTDLGYYNYIKSKGGNITQVLNDENNFIRAQKRIFIRVGLTRLHQDKYWIQINGIYTFPEFNTEIRSYK